MMGIAKEEMIAENVKKKKVQCLQHHIV